MSRILVIGHVNLDIPIRLSGSLCSGGRFTASFSKHRLGGGGANTSLALALAGHQVTLAAAVGSGPDGDHLLEVLESYGVNLTQVLRHPGQTRRVLVLLDDQGERTMVVEDREETPLPVDRLVEIPASCLYARSHVPGMTGLLKERLHQGWVVAALPPDLQGTRPAHVLLASADDLPDLPGQDLFAAALRIGGPHLKWLVVTKGSRGSTAFSSSSTIEVSAVPAEIADTTGAGDAFAAGLIHGLLRDKDIESAMTTGAGWAAAAVASPTSVPPETIRNLA